MRISRGKDAHPSGDPCASLRRLMRISQAKDAHLFLRVNMKLTGLRA
jgi:hypothetical protein